MEPPGDKSVGHRLALLAALARGRSQIDRYPPGKDCHSTLSVLEALGTPITLDADRGRVSIEGRGNAGFSAPLRELDAGNSGTTARLVAGVLAAQPFDSTIVGDASLSLRPFGRVIAPLTEMGGVLESATGGLPLHVLGGRELHGIEYSLPVPSAQVKSAILLAGIHASGETRVVETFRSRDHTEIALRTFGASVTVEGSAVSVSCGEPLLAGEHEVPGDFSSAAFFIGAAAFLPGSDLLVQNVGLNPTRTGFLDALRAMGAEIEVEAEETTSGRGERTGTVRVRSSALVGTTVPAERVPSLVDEVPILAVVASFADGETRLEGLSELRVKESDRLSALAEGLDALGVRAEVHDDDLVIQGSQRELRAARLPSYRDHRLVMAWAVAALGVAAPCEIDHLDQVKISYPGFWTTLNRLAA